MVTKWDDRFDIVSGAVIVDPDCDPLMDSGVWDLVHGPKDPCGQWSSSPAETIGDEDDLTYDI